MLAVVFSHKFNCKIGKSILKNEDYQPKYLSKLKVIIIVQWAWGITWIIPELVVSARIC